MSFYKLIAWCMLQWELGGELEGLSCKCSSPADVISGEAINLSDIGFPHVYNDRQVTGKGDPQYDILLKYSSFVKL